MQDTAMRQATHEVTAQLPAERIGCYRVDQLLGEGGFGCVRAGFDLRLQRPVALKFLRVDAGGHEALREARLATAARHPALVAIHEVLLERDTAVIVMERVFGTTLRDALNSRRFAPHEVADIVRQTAQALASLHAQGFAHGDIKPSNLMLESGGRVRLLDFGLAQALDVTQSLRSDVAPRDPLLGTPAYMAPERLAGATPAPPSDIYALGLVGRALQNAASGTDDTSSPAAAKRLSDALATLFDGMTQAAPAQRPPDMRAVVTRLDALLAAANAAAQDALPPSRPGRAPVAAIAVLLLAVIAAMGWWRREASPRATMMVAPPAASATQLSDVEPLLLDFTREGAVTEAITRLQALPARERERAPAQAMLAIAYGLRYADEGRDPAWLAQARRHAAQAMAGDDQFALAWAAQAWVLEFEGHAAQAEAAYLRALRLDPRNIHALGGYVRLLTAALRLDEADAVLKDALSRHPQVAQLWDALGTLRYRQGDAPDAERAFRRSLALAPASAHAHANLAASLLRQDRSDDALAVLQQGLALRPHGRLYTNLGNILYARGHYAEAASAFEAALSDARGGANDYLRWANHADALRWIPARAGEAVEAYRAALRLLQPMLREGRGDPVRLSRAALYAARSGDVAQAQRWIDAALAQGETDADLQLRATLVADALGQRESALAHLREALALGYPAHLLQSDPDLRALRDDPRFPSLSDRSIR